MEIKTFDITCSYLGEHYSVTLDASLYTESDVLENLKTQQEESGTTPEPEEYDEDFFEVQDWGYTPDWAQDWGILSELIPAWDKSHNDLDVFEAAHDADIQFSDVDEVYQGSYEDDEDFAQETAEQLGYINKEVRWPYTCIDWNQAARELMDDYSAANGHYFRNI